MVVRPRRLPTFLLAVLFLGGLCAAPGPSARAQGNSLFPKGNPNRTLPQATPLPRGALKPGNGNSPAAATSSARRRPAPPPRPDTVALPYNLVWFDNQNRLASLFAGVSAKVTEKKTEGPNEIWTVKELIAPNLRTSFFTFQQGLLIGLEFDYGQDSWDTDKYNEVMGQFRRLLETKCEAPGEIISRKTDQAPGTTIKETLMGYQWARGDTSVQLFYYSAEDTAKAMNFRSISVHYHYRDPFAPPPGSEPSPAPGAQPSPGGQTASVTVTPNGPDNSPGGALPLPDNTPPPAGTPASSPKPTPAPSPSPAPGAATPAPAATAAPTDNGLPGPDPVEGSEDNGDAAAAMAPVPAASPETSPTPTPTPAPSATPPPTPSPTPKKSSTGRRKRG